MKRLFRFGKSKKKERKERLSPPEFSTSDEVFPATSPMYQYARNEFAQTVGAGTSNDDGRGVLYISPSNTPSRLFTDSDEDLGQASLVANAASNSPTFSQTQSTWTSPAAVAQSNADNQHHYPSLTSPNQIRPESNNDNENAASSNAVEQPSQAHAQHHFNQHPSTGSISLVASRSVSLIEMDDANQSQSPSLRQALETSHYQPPQYAASAANFADNNSIKNVQNNNNPTSPTENANLDPDYIAACSASNLGRQESLFSQTSSQYPTRNPSQISHQKNYPYKNSTGNNNQHMEYPPSWEMPDATYEEEYGDAYIGGPIRYIYPSGYQSMRPRSGPWKLSIVVCILFTWLSVFIVGHCSDRVDSDVSQYNQSEIDDDTLVIETRWCGSRLLYLMWVISMLVTGLSAAYCSIIGYIKVRDFAVANGRSQPPGMIGKTDFYAHIDDAAPAPPLQRSSSQGSHASFGNRNHYHVPIYQADGNPQFWGGHIYRPTQAAVAITSR